MKRKIKRVRRKLKKFLRKRTFPLRRLPNSQRKFSVNFEYQVAILTNVGAQPWYPQLIVPLNFPNIAIVDNGNGGGALLALSGAQAGTLGHIVPPDIYATYFPATPIFDTYKVKRLSVRFVPSAIDVNTNLAPGSTNLYTQTVMYQFNDLDDVTLPNPGSPNASVINHYLNNGAHPTNWNTARKNGINFKLKQPRVTKNTYLNCGLVANNNVPLPGNAPTLGSSVFPNAFTSMKLIWQALGVAANQTCLGYCYIRWEVTFKGVPSLL